MARPHGPYSSPVHRATPIGTIAVEHSGSSRLEQSPASNASPGAANNPGLADTLAALAHAFDLAEGHPLGHTVRSTLIGMRLGAEAGIGNDDRDALLYALLLKDCGGSSVSAQLSEVFARDDREVKSRIRFVEHAERFAFGVATLRTMAPDASPVARLRRTLRITRNEEFVRQIARARAEYGAEMVAGLGLPPASAEAVQALDERWDGNGFPNGIAGNDIPLLGRIATLARAMDLHNAWHGADRTIRMVRSRKGKAFDPGLAELVLSWSEHRGWWRSVGLSDAANRLAMLQPPALQRPMDEVTIDLVARTFADIVDAKSPFTARHSVLVASYADVIGEEYGLDETARKQLRRAGLLHDIGKLAVSNRILDKSGGLAPEERQEMERHPLHTWEILSGVGVFHDVARLAALHHEKLDGSGYPWRIPGDRLPAAARVLVVADTIAALTADRPFRRGLQVDETIGILRRDRTTRLCARAVDAAESVLASGKLEIGSEEPLARAGIVARAGAWAAA